MQTESLVKLTAAGNLDTVEQEWMRLIEDPQTTSEALVGYKSVLSELGRIGKTSQAETWAWAAIEAVGVRETPESTLRIAGQFLNAIGESADLRAQVSELYRKVHAHRPNLEGLLTEAGLPGGRPVRRALRTLEVVLELSEGGFLAARDEDLCAKVNSIDTEAWRYTIQSGSSIETLGAVALADRFHPVSADDYRVQRQFAPKDLGARLNDDPVNVVLEICRAQGNKLGSDALELFLVPRVFSLKEYEAWWSKARTALKKCPNVKLEGRSPYFLTYVEQPASKDDLLTAEFAKLRDPRERWGLVEKYVRDCKSRGESPARELLRSCHEMFRDYGRRTAIAESPTSLLYWTIGQRLGLAADAAEPGADLQEFLKRVSHFSSILGDIDDPVLLDFAARALLSARPDDGMRQLLESLPRLPQSFCDRAVELLLAAGTGMDEIRAAVQQIFASPVANFDALLWLFDGPANAEVRMGIAPAAVLARILRTLDDCRRTDAIPKDRVRKMAARAKSVLTSRRCERFVTCLDGMDSTLASALRTQINQLETLTRGTRDELLDHLVRKFPIRTAESSVERWEQEEIIYCSAEGYARKRKERDHHVNVKMRDNARAIGAAAEHGDLSENSEYKFALEERDLLQARLMQMDAELSRAKIMRADDVPSDRVGIGSAVTLRDVEGSGVHEFVIVGPWEADPTVGRFSYKTPVAQGILGKRVGDRIELNLDLAVGEFEIAALGNALLHTPKDAAVPASAESSQGSA